MSSDSSTPDLASILATLAGLAPQNQQTQQVQQVQPVPQSLQAQPSQQFHQPLPYVTQQPHPQQWHQPPLSYPAPRSSTPVDAPKIRLIDPATLIDWSSGLKCVMRTVAKQESILHDIRRMIKSQHEHEQQWWNGRQDLIERQKARKEGQKKLNDVLKLVGGAVTTGGASNTSPEELATELQTFDLKVYRAQTQMTKEFSAKLKSLGVPFFGTKVELVRVAKKDGSKEKYSQAPKSEKGMIDELELVKLQKKMVDLLEDLCGD